MILTLLYWLCLQWITVKFECMNDICNALRTCSLYILFQKLTHHPCLEASCLFILFVCSVDLILSSSLMMLYPWLFLRALTINSFLFLLLLRVSVSMQLNLASTMREGGCVKKATMRLKITFQVEYRLHPLLSRPSVSQSSRPPIHDYSWGVSIWSRLWAKNSSQMKLPPTSFPLVLLFHFHFSLYLVLGYCEFSAGKWT